MDYKTIETIVEIGIVIGLSRFLIKTNYQLIKKMVEDKRVLSEEIGKYCSTHIEEVAQYLELLDKHGESVVGRVLFWKPNLLRKYFKNHPEKKMIFMKIWKWLVKY